MNSKTSQSKGQWLPCESGAIESAASSIRSRKDLAARRQFLRAAASATVVVAGAGLAGWSLFGQRDELNALYNNPNYPGGIACSEVQRLMVDYINESLNDDVTESIKIHLTKCSHCCDVHDFKVSQMDVA